MGAEQRERRRVAARRRRRARRRRLAGGAALLAMLGAVVAALAGSSGGSHARTRLTRAATPAARMSAHPEVRKAVARPRPQRRAESSPGSLPQTHAFPSGTSREFRVLMDALWRGIVADSAAAALPAFFPRGAYVQLKAIPSAASDWSGRLVRDYGLDIAAAHALLGRDAAGAELVRVSVVSSYGHWVPPGVCYNDIGYWEAPNARVVYREDGQVRSFGISSMISWRGVWYVVHLGAVLRSGDEGAVDEPASGPGTSAYSGTC